MKLITSIFVAVMLILAIFTGCASQTTDTTESASPSATATTVVSDTTADDAMFTDRDKEIGYSEAESTIVTLADDATTANGEGVTIFGNTITINTEGTFILSGSLSNGQLVVDAADDAKIQIVLNGADITNESSAAIYVINADKVFLTTAANTENSVSVTGEYVAIDENSIDAAVFSKTDLTLNGAGTLTINAKYGHGVVSKDDLVVTCGSYVIKAEKQGLSGKNSLRIADGEFAITAGTDGLHSENADDTTLGFVYIAGGTFSISAGKQGISGTRNVSVLGGTIDIAESYEGIEGLTINISGGDITIASSDDGLNAAGGNDGSGGMAQGGMGAVEGCEIIISGGTLTIDANGDGIDSNGNLTISGGVITVNGPANQGNGALDFAGTSEITGGTLLAASNGGMDEGFSDSSTQASIVYSLGKTQSAGTSVSLKDSSGNLVAEFTPTKQFSAVYFSVPELANGETYTLCVGSEEYSVELTSVSFTNGGGMGMGGGQGNQMPSGGQGGPGGGGNGKTPPSGTMPDANSSATVQQ
ncbi:MAG: carbohydrate-binding domain-containing protein [Oscillospiraceae bacterium]|nr:carbohydrate-binding domain-containing protein [Oscillospiraceae bacterium]